MTVTAAGLRAHIEKLLQIDTESKPEVYKQVFQSADVFNLNYSLELLLSAGIATLGLVLNSPAVVIGAMLISPLMGPILAAGLALAASDLYLGIKSLLGIAASMMVSILFSALLVWLLPFQSPTAEILARTQPNLLDLAVALFSGLAGSIVVCRGGTGGGVTALPGVAVAVALMPPLCTVGFGVGSGWVWPIISGAGLLFLTNLTAIIACAFFVFYIIRMDAPEIRVRIGYTSLEQASPDRLYRLLEKTRLRQSLGDIGHLRWRILMLVVSLAILFVPLRSSLIHLRDETLSRAAVREALRLLGPPDSILAQRLDLEAGRIQVSLVVAGQIPSEQVQQAERHILRRTGKEATINIRKVAGEEEIALLRDRLRPPPPPPAPPASFESLRQEIMGRVEPVIKEAWPEQAAPLKGYEVSLTQQGVTVRIRYEAVRPLEAGLAEVFTKLLENRLNYPDLQIELVRQRPSRSRASTASK